MNTGKGVMASFIACLVLITYRDFKTPDSAWPLGPVPPPYRFTWAAVVFGILAIVSDMFSPKIATVVSIGVVIGLLFQVVTNPTGGTAGLLSLAPGATDKRNPINNGTTGSSALGNSSGVQQV